MVLWTKVKEEHGENFGDYALKRLDAAFKLLGGIAIMRGYLFGILSAVFWALSGLLYNELPLSEYDALGKIISLLFF